jgi:RNA-directed DNA polymerase
MTAINDAGASSHQKVNWSEIDWLKANQTVRRLQARIVKAVQENRWGKVKALQHLLTRSFSGKALAVRRVTENRGKKTPGVDQIIWNTPEKKAQAVEALRQRGYKSSPLRRVYIEKSGGNGHRALHIPTMKDRAMQALYLLVLDPIAERTGDPNSYGFRNQRSTADAIGQCFNALVHKHCAQWILKCDIRACFDSISHEWLLAHIPMEKAILRQWLKAGFIDKHIFYSTEEGVPQGGIASPVIANLALDGLERVLREKYPTNTNQARRAKVNMVRYADDTIITGGSPELLKDEVLPIVEKFMNERGLELSNEKTSITHIEDGFDFLGQNLRKYKGKLLITPAKKSVQSLLQKVRKVVKENKTVAAGHLIVRLNPIIHGWANYHRHVVSKSTFIKVDSAIFETIWRWAKRRHPKKTRWWVADKYFRTHKARRWVFSGEASNDDGTTKHVWLFRASSVPIKRHVKIKGEANPYDPQWEVYFEQRLGVKMAHELCGHRKLLCLWRKQNGLCPVCNQKITKITGWHSHHIIWRTHGGKDGTENLVLLHPECHRQVHSLKLEIARPHSLKSVRKA